MWPVVACIANPSHLKLRSKTYLWTRSSTVTKSEECYCQIVANKKMNLSGESPTPAERVTRQEGQGSPNGGNRLQVSLKILCCHDNTWFPLNLTFLKLWASQCVFLTEMFFLSYVNETMYLLWNLPFFKMVPPKTNVLSFLKTWADNSSTNQYSYQLLYGWGMTHLLPSYLKTAYCGRGAWWNSVSLEASLLSD